jgi:uracil phosphoribosyltransferase
MNALATEPVPTSRALREMPSDAAKLVVLSHPLVRHHITQLRRAETHPAEFRRLVRRLAVLLAYEATSDLLIDEHKVQTPLAEATGGSICERIALIPILRAGLGMVDPILDLIPDAQVWHLGIYRDEATAEPVEYYSKLPADRPVDTALVLDPMLATGGSVLAAVDAVERWGAGKVKVLSIIASRHGIGELQRRHKRAQIYVAAVDPELNDRKFIVPGLGDAGDRTFNTLS